MTSLLQRALDAPWAMLPADIERVVSIAERENAPTPEALEAIRAQSARFGERVKVRDNVALIYAQGPMFKGANLFVEISGATSYEIMRRDLQAALDAPTIDAIMLVMDSPGGEAQGCDELATAIFEARSKKRIETYVSGFACSGGYWLAAATSQITVSDLATLGSVGVVLGVTDRSKADERSGRLEFVSSQSPNKRPDLSENEGRAQIQKYVDDMGDVFVRAVAKYRGIKPGEVISKFGAGGLEVGANAVAAGMADTVGQFEAALAALSIRGRNSRFLARSSGGKAMSSENPVDLAKVSSDARSEERARLTKITGHKAFASHKSVGDILVEAGIDAETSVKILDQADACTAAAVEAAAKPAPEPTRDHEKEKAAAGALGLGGVEIPNATKEAVASGWAKAFGRG